MIPLSVKMDDKAWLPRCVLGFSLRSNQDIVPHPKLHPVIQIWSLLDPKKAKMATNITLGALKWSSIDVEA